MSDVKDCWRELILQTRSYLAILRDGDFAYAEGTFEPVAPKRRARSAKAPSRQAAPGRGEARSLPKDALADPYAHLSAPASRQTAPSAAASTPKPAAEPSNLLRDPDAAREKIAAAENLEQLGELVARCRLCSLGAGRTNPVFGVGNPNAELVFVGEAPGYYEDIQGEPFVGRAGELLTKMIAKMGLRREDVYICNILKSRPPNNRDPQPAEIKACEPFLQRQLDLLRPKVICTLGRIAVQALLRDTTPIGKLRGKWRLYHDIPLMPTFHPAYLLRDPNKRHEAWEDLQAIMAKLAESKGGS